MATVRVQIRWALRRLGARGPRITWFSLPNAAPLRGRLGDVGSAFYYQDRYDAFTNVDSHWLRGQIQELAKNCTTVIASSEALADDVRALGADPVVVSHGVDAERFSRAAPVPPDIAELERPLVGYVGVLDDFVSTAHVRAVADRLSRGTVVLVGPVNTAIDSLTHPRIRVMGPRPYGAVPAYIRSFDCCLIPFEISRLTRAVNPIKLREYLAAGRAVVSTPLPEVQRYSHVVRFGELPADFADAVEQVLADEAEDPDAARKRQRSVADESWDAIAAKLETLLRRSLAEP